MKPIPLLALQLPLPPILYLGCYREAGHYFFVPGMRSLHSWSEEADRKNDTTLAKLDGGFAPQDTTAPFEAWFHCEFVNGTKYSVISFWDYTVDSRGGCNSTFLLIGEHKCFADSLADCKQAFPEIFARFPVVKLRRNMFVGEDRA